MEFIPNQCQVTGSGRDNPHWKNIIPLDLSNSLIISSKENSSRINFTLQKNNIFFTHEKFKYFDLFIIRNRIISQNLYWNGIDINYIENSVNPN